MNVSTANCRKLLSSFHMHLLGFLESSLASHRNLIHPRDNKPTKTNTNTTSGHSWAKTSGRTLYFSVWRMWRKSLKLCKFGCARRHQMDLLQLSQFFEVSLWKSSAIQLFQSFIELAFRHLFCSSLQAIQVDEICGCGSTTKELPTGTNLLSFIMLQLTYIQQRPNQAGFPDD